MNRFCLNFTDKLIDYNTAYSNNFRPYLIKESSRDEILCRVLHQECVPEAKNPFFSICLKSYYIFH